MTLLLLLRSHGMSDYTTTGPHLAGRIASVPRAGVVFADSQRSGAFGAPNPRPAS